MGGISSSLRLLALGSANVPQAPWRLSAVAQAPPRSCPFESHILNPGNNNTPLTRGILLPGSGGGIRTHDQEINSLLRYRCATPE